MAHEPKGMGWLDMFGTLPLPVAILDADYRFLLLNQASRADPILARSRLGEPDLGCCQEEPAALARARERRRQYERSLHALKPLFFEEETATEAGAPRRCLWICLPVQIQEERRLIVIGLGADLAEAGRDEPEAGLQFVQQVHREMRAPLTALVGLAGTLASELSGEQRSRALLIDQSGQRLLRHLNLLMEKTQQATERPARLEAE